MKNYSINFSSTETDFEKSMTAATYDEALELAKDRINWPLEFTDYSKMKVVISDSNGETSLDYIDLTKKATHKVISRTTGLIEFEGSYSECNSYMSKTADTGLFGINDSVWDADGKYNSIKSN